MKKYFLFLIIVITIGCTTEKGKTFNFEGEPLTFKYATHIAISQLFDGYVVTIRNPWDTTKILHKYFLTEKDSVLSYNDYTIIHIPVSNVLIFTSLHASLVKMIGCKNCIKSLCDVEYILDSTLLSDVKSNKIINVGSSLNPDIENIILQNPQIIMLSPYQNSGSFGLLGKLGIPLVECADYMENSPLAQAEWIKFYGLLFNKLDIADSIFNQVESNYLQLKALVDSTKNRPTLLANSLTGVTWYMPSGNSTAGKFYTDAGFNFLFSHLQQYGTVPLNFESVFAQAHDADFWIVKYNRDIDYNLQSFLLENSNYQNFKAFKNKNIYFCNLSYIPYYDETPFRPDLLLNDLVKISHPNLLPNYSLRYFKKVGDGL